MSEKRKRMRNKTSFVMCFFSLFFFKMFFHMNEVWFCVLDLRDKKKGERAVMVLGLNFCLVVWVWTLRYTRQEKWSERVDITKIEKSCI